MAAARAIILTQECSKLVEIGGHIEINLAWVYFLLNCMKSIKWKTTTAKSKLTVRNFAQAKKDFLDNLVVIVEMEEISLPELLTGTKLV